MRSVGFELPYDFKFRPTDDNGGHAQDKPLPGPSQTPQGNGETQDKPLFRAQAMRSLNYRLQVCLHLLCSDDAVLAGPDKDSSLAAGDAEWRQRLPVPVLTYCWDASSQHRLRFLG